MEIIVKIQISKKKSIEIEKQRLYRKIKTYCKEIEKKITYQELKIKSEPYSKQGNGTYEGNSKGD